MHTSIQEKKKVLVSMSCLSAPVVIFCLFLFLSYPVCLCFLPHTVCSCSCPILSGPLLLYPVFVLVTYCLLLFLSYPVWSFVVISCLPLFWSHTVCSCSCPILSGPLLSYPVCLCFGHILSAPVLVLSCLVLCCHILSAFVLVTYCLLLFLSYPVFVLITYSLLLFLSYPVCLCFLPHTFCSCFCHILFAFVLVISCQILFSSYPVCPCSYLNLYMPVFVVSWLILLSYHGQSGSCLILQAPALMCCLILFWSYPGSVLVLFYMLLVLLHPVLPYSCCTLSGSVLVISCLIHFLISLMERQK